MAKKPRSSAHDSVADGLIKVVVLKAANRLRASNAEILLADNAQHRALIAAGYLRIVQAEPTIAPAEPESEGVPDAAPTEGGAAVSPEEG